MEQNAEKSKKQAENGVNEYIHEGQLCPNCRFARFVKEPGNIIRCPICGYDNGAGCT